MLTEQEVWDALPPTGFVRSYVEYASGCTDAHVAYHLAGALTCLTQAAPLEYCVPYASPLWANLFTMIVGSSSKSRKTASINITQRVMRDALPGCVGEMPGSQEGLYESLRAQQRQVIIYGEFGEFLAKAEDGYLMALKTTYTNLWDCLDSDTEVLTANGWRGRGQVAIGDLVYSMNPATGKLELVPALDVGERPVRDGEKMFVLKGQRTNIRTTEGHRFYLRGADSTAFTVLTGAEFALTPDGYSLPAVQLPDGSTTEGAIDQRPTLEDPTPGEIVWCLSNRNETIVTRRKGKVAIVGNCIAIGRALAKNRRGSIDNPRLTLLCGVATDLLERHTEQSDWTGGFLSRFLTFHAEPEREFATPPVDDAVKRQAITNWLRQLATHNAPFGPCLWLDAQGNQMWHDWYEDMRKIRDGSTRRTAAACARTTAIAAKTALLLALDVGQARSGQPWHVGATELESALKIAELHLKSVIELGERVTGSRDMRDRALVLRCISDMPTPFGYILRSAELLKRRVNEILDTLIEERAVISERLNGELCYRQTPHLQQALASMAQASTSIAPAGYGPTIPVSNVIAMRGVQAVQSVPLVPLHDALNDDDGWASFDG